MQHICYTVGMLIQDCDATLAVHSPIVTMVPPLVHLRDLRLRRALTQVDLATLSGVSRATIIRLEAGERNVQPPTLRKLARALRVKVAELMA